MLMSYCRFYVEIHAEDHHLHVGGVVRYCDLVAKIKIAKFFPGMFVGDSRKICAHINFPLYGIPEDAHRGAL